MTHTYKISEFGLQLIKAYEGFRPVEVELLSGHRVIGYGHRYQENEEPVITRATAETMLRHDLAAYEDMVNENVFAPLSQSQFDALVSLAFNIGPKSFLSSSVVHALNNGRPLEAANGFDVWCKSKIDGKVYVVDALVRRRTAEKALFLRAAEGVVSAPRLAIPPKADDRRVEALAQDASEDILDVFHKRDAAKTIAPPYAKPVPPANPLSGSNELVRNHASKQFDLEEAKSSIDLTDKTKVDDAPDPVEASVSETDAKPLSPIVVAAKEVSERLDRLIADTPDRKDELVDERQNDHMKAQTLQPSTENTFDEKNELMNDNNRLAAANEGSHPEYRRPGRAAKAQDRTPDRYIVKANDEEASVKINRPRTEEGLLTRLGSNISAFWLTLIAGAMMLGGGAMKWYLGPKYNVPAYGTDQTVPMWAPLITLLGAMIVLAALYYLIKSYFKRQH